MTEHRDEWVSYCWHRDADGEPCDCAPSLVEVVEERDRLVEALRSIAAADIRVTQGATDAYVMQDVARETLESVRERKGA